MAEVAAVSAGLQAYSGAAVSMAAHIGSVATTTAACGPAVLAPVFGIVGGEFLAAFTGVHTAHSAAIARLSEVVDSLGVAVSSAALAYDATDAQTAASLT